MEAPFHIYCRVCVGDHSSRTACLHLAHRAWLSGNPECSICRCGSHHCCDLSGGWLGMVEGGRGGRGGGGGGGGGGAVRRWPHDEVSHCTGTEWSHPPSSFSFSATAILMEGYLRATSRAVAMPTIPPPTTTKSYGSWPAAVVSLGGGGNNHKLNVKVSRACLATCLCSCNFCTTAQRSC